MDKQAIGRIELIFKYSENNINFFLNIYKSIPLQKWELTSINMSTRITFTIAEDDD